MTSFKWFAHEANIYFFGWVMEIKPHKAYTEDGQKLQHKVNTTAEIQTERCKYLHIYALHSGQLRQPGTYLSEFYRGCHLGLEFLFFFQASK